MARTRLLALSRFGPWLIGLWLVAVVAAPWPARAQLELDITEGVVEPLPIAISEFYGATPAAAQRGREIADVVSADLERSGLFRPIDRRAFIQSPDQLRSLPRFADWRQINAEALVTGEVSGGEDGGDLEVEFRLWDVFAGIQLRGLRFATGADNWRRVAHKVADAVYERITGETGYFDTRIVYVAESGPATDRVKRLAIMDQDGANHQFLTDGSELVLTPRFDAAGAEIAFLTYRGRQPQVHRLDLATGIQTKLGDFEGMTFAPQFAPDGRRIALSFAEDGNSDIYVLDLISREQRRLTDHPAIDTSPSFAPDGRRLVFNSDRAGTPQLYVMNANGSAVQRISFGSGHYGSPAWSPRGDLIAFTKIQGGQFHIGVMRPDGSDERLLTRSTLDEGPAWAPNGRVIVFTREDYGTDRSRLFSIDVTGYNERELPTPLDASDPDWSNLVP
jgi:TolB protein